MTAPHDLEQRIRRLYTAFNRQDIDNVLPGLAEDVVWANGLEGGHVHGREAVRAYWTRQFEQIRSTVEPQRLEQLPDDRLAVDVHQVVRSADGSEVLGDTTVRHVFTFTGNLIGRFDIE